MSNLISKPMATDFPCTHGQEDQLYQDLRVDMRTCLQIFLKV
jgi:hypothetical protein